MNTYEIAIFMSQKGQMLAVSCGLTYIISI